MEKEPSLTGESLRHKLCSRWAIGIIFTLVLAVQAFLQLGAVSAGRPYENWDEIATFTTSHEISGPRAERIYGSIDTFMQWTAIKLYDAFDPVGREYPNARYSNNFPASWSDPSAVQNTLGSWPGKYFRGMDDRQPIFLSRYIHLAFAYLLVAVIGWMVVTAYGREAVFVLIPMLCLTVAAEVYFQTTQSLPNAINAILSFAVVLFAIIYVDRRRPIFLYASVIALVIGFNFKFDIIVMTAAPALALLLMATVDFRAALRTALWAGGMGAMTLVLTCPYLVSDPVMILRQYYHGLTGTAPVGITPAQISATAAELLRMLEGNVAVAGLGKFAGLLLVALSMIAAFAVSIYRRDRMSVLLSLTALLALFCWLIIVFRLPNASARHFVNGLGVFFAVLGMTMMLAHRQSQRWRWLASALLVCFALQFTANAALASWSSLSVRRTAQGQDLVHTRVRATLAVVELMRGGRFQNPVLIDQHAYMDLRMLRQHGIRTRYVNLTNLDDTRVRMTGTHLVVFSPGTFDKSQGFYRDWMGDWPADTKKAYEAYRAELSALPVVRRFDGPAQNVLSIAPVNAPDAIHISSVSAR